MHAIEHAGIANLAALMGRQESEVASFVDALRIYTSKGASVEEAIAANLRTLQSLLDNVNDGLSRPYSVHRPAANALLAHCTDMVWKEVH